MMHGDPGVRHVRLRDGWFRNLVTFAYKCDKTSFLRLLMPAAALRHMTMPYIVLAIAEV